jgi:preprotein translocase subunit Sec63
MLTSSTGNYYKILELKQNCTHTEIRRAYKRLALVHHPDKNGGDKKAEERFKTVLLRVLFSKFGHKLTKPSYKMHTRP